MMRDGEYIVLRSGATHERFCSFASSLGMSRLHVVEGDGKHVPYEDVWKNPGQTQLLYYVIDATSGSRFVWARGQDCEALGLRARAELESFSADELVELATWSKDHDQRVHALYGSAVACPRFNAAALNAFLMAVMDASPLIRMAALSAMMYRAWPECRQALYASADTDPDDRVRALAARYVGMYEALRQQEQGSSAR